MVNISIALAAKSLLFFILVCSILYSVSRASSLSLFCIQKAFCKFVIIVKPRGQSSSVWILLRGQECSPFNTVYLLTGPGTWLPLVLPCETGMTSFYILEISACQFRCKDTGKNKLHYENIPLNQMSLIVCLLAEIHTVIFEFGYEISNGNMNFKLRNY